MDAPLYPPASAFEQPIRIPRQISLTNASIAELQQIPAAWALVVKAIPYIDMLIGSEQLKVHLGNFSFYSLVPFGLVQPAMLDQLNAQLLALDIVQ